MHPEVFAVIAYSIFSFVGGIRGYAKAQSKVSLISGVINSVLLILGGILQLQGVWEGFPLALIVAVALIVVWSPTHQDPKINACRIDFLAGISTLTGMLSSIDFLLAPTIYLFN